MNSEEEMTLSEEMTMGEMARALIRIERKLDTQTLDHEQRLRSLEKWMYAAIAGGAAGAASGVGALFTSGVF